MCVRGKLFRSYGHLSKPGEYKSEVHEEKGGDVVSIVLQCGKIPWSLFLAPCSCSWRDEFSWSHQSFLYTVWQMEEAESRGAVHNMGSLMQAHRSSPTPAPPLPSPACSPSRPSSPVTCPSFAAVVGL